METTNRRSWPISVAAIIAIAVTVPAGLAGQSAAKQFSPRNSDHAMQWSVEVTRVDAADVFIANSFQVAIYENLIQELKNTNQFKQVFRDGDRSAREVPNLLVLKTIVWKYTPGSETQRAVTTVSGATKLTVRSQLLTREGNVVFARTVNGNVRFFGGNLRATHNLARNIAKDIKRSSWAVSEQPTAMVPGQL